MQIAIGGCLEEAVSGCRRETDALEEQRAAALHHKDSCASAEIKVDQVMPGRADTFHRDTPLCSTTTAGSMGICVYSVNIVLI